MADRSFTLRLRLADDGLHDKVNLHKHDDKADHDDECGKEQSWGFQIVSLVSYRTSKTSRALTQQV